MPKQTVHCQIESCMHNAPDHYCSLNAIKVAPCAPHGCTEVNRRSESMCANFERKDMHLFD